MLSLRDSLTPKGTVSVISFNADKVPAWKAFEALVGRRRPLTADLMHQLVRDRIARSWLTQRNLIVNAGLTALANELTAGTAFQLAFVGVGSGTTTPATPRRP